MKKEKEKVIRLKAERDKMPFELKFAIFSCVFSVIALILQIVFACIS